MRGRLSSLCTRAIHCPLLHQECFPLSSGSPLSLNLTFRLSSSLQGLVRFTTARASAALAEAGSCKQVALSATQGKYRPQLADKPLKVRNNKTAQPRSTSVQFLAPKLTQKYVARFSKELNSLRALLNVCLQAHR